MVMKMSFSSQMVGRPDANVDVLFLSGTGRLQVNGSDIFQSELAGPTLMGISFFLSGRPTLC